MLMVPLPGDGVASGMATSPAAGPVSNRLSSIPAVVLTGRVLPTVTLRSRILRPHILEPCVERGAFETAGGGEGLGHRLEAGAVLGENPAGPGLCHTEMPVEAGAQARVDGSGPIGVGRGPDRAVVAEAELALHGHGQPGGAGKIGMRPAAGAGGEGAEGARR